MAYQNNALTLTDNFCNIFSSFVVYAIFQQSSYCDLYEPVRLISISFIIAAINPTTDFPAGLCRADRRPHVSPTGRRTSPGHALIVSPVMGDAAKFHFHYRPIRDAIASCCRRNRFLTMNKSIRRPTDRSTYHTRMRSWTQNHLIGGLRSSVDRGANKSARVSNGPSDVGCRTGRVFAE